MALKVKDIYKKISEQYSNITLVAGEGGMSNLVNWFHMVEKEEIAQFLEGKEIVVTTGIALKENNESLFEIVKGCLNNDASAIIVNLGPYITEIDNEIIQFCNDNSFPIFSAPWEVYMANVVKIIAQEVARSHEKSIELVSAFKNAICFPAQHESYVSILERYDYEIEWHYCISIVRVEDKQTKKSIDHDTLRTIRKRIENVLAFLAPKSIVFRLHDEIIVCFANRSEESIITIMKQLLNNISRQMKNKYHMYIGIGRNTMSVRCIYKTYNIAQKVVRLQKRMNHEYEVLSYKELGISKLFLAMEDNEIMNEFYSNVLEPLVEYDQHNHSDYVTFLDIYFEEECHIQAIADRLYLHRNSINYKIKKIEDILQCDLNEFSVKTEIMIALKLRLLL